VSVITLHRTLRPATDRDTLSFEELRALARGELVVPEPGPDPDAARQHKALEHMEVALREHGVPAEGLSAVPWVETRGDWQGEFFLYLDPDPHQPETPETVQQLRDTAAALRRNGLTRVLPVLPALGQGHRTGVTLCQPVSTSVLLVTYRAPLDAT